MTSPLKTWLRSAALALGAITITAAAPACAQEPVTIRIGFASVGLENRQFAGGSTAALAHAERYLEEEFKNDPNVKIQWSFFKGAGPAVNEAFAAEQLDFAHHGDLPSIIGRANGLKTKILLITRANTPTYLAVPNGSDIKGIADLKGRSVAYHVGTNQQLAIAKILAASGLSERDLKIVNMNPATSYAALAAGEVDAVFGDNQLYALEEKGLAKVVYTTKGQDPAFGRNSQVHVTETFEQAHPELTARVVKAFVKAAHWASLEENRDKLFEVWARTGTPAAQFKQDFADETLVFRNTPLLDEFMVAQYATQARQAKEYGLVRRPVDVTGWFEPKYLDAALKELKLETFWTRYGADGKPQGS
jgi:sulfonate transport system substrate-binding protein